VRNLLAAAIPHRIERSFQNLSVVNFLDSDWTYVNKSLARLYGIVAQLGERGDGLRDLIELVALSETFASN
jgi:hypothetical protein